MPGFKKAQTEADFRRIVRKTERALADTRGELRGLRSHLGRRFAKAPLRQYAKEYVDEFVKEHEAIEKGAQGAYNRYLSATRDFLQKTRKGSVHQAAEHIQTIVHDIMGLEAAISSFAGSWAQEVDDQELISRVQASEGLSEDAQAGRYHG